jgi:hypothetical protein
MSGFDYIKVCITESINRGSRRKYITPDEALKSARRRSREMGLDPDKIEQEARARREVKRKKQEEDDAAERARVKQKRIDKYTSDTSKISRIKMWLSDPEAAQAATDKINADIKKAREEEKKGPGEGKKGRD